MIGGQVHGSWRRICMGQSKGQSNVSMCASQRLFTLIGGEVYGGVAFLVADSDVGAVAKSVLDV